MLRIKPTLLAVAVLASAQASASDDDLRINGFMSSRRRYVIYR